MVFSKQPFRRSDRVADVVRQVVSEELMRYTHLKGLQGVTVTGVNVTNDLQHARIFFRVLDPSKRDEASVALGKVSHAVRKVLGHELKMRYTPDLHFEYDTSLEYGDRIETLLRSVRHEGSEE